MNPSLELIYLQDKYLKFSKTGGNNTSLRLPGLPLTSATDVTIEFNENNAAFRFDNTLLVCRLIDGKYPNYEAVIPKTNPNKLNWLWPMNVTGATPGSLNYNPNYVNGQWDTRIATAGGSPKASFRQSTFNSRPLARHARMAAEDHVPELGEAGLIDLAILQGMAASQPLGAIAETMLVQFPGKFPSKHAALNRAARVSGLYNRDLASRRQSRAESDTQTPT